MTWWLRLERVRGCDHGAAVGGSARRHEVQPESANVALVRRALEAFFRGEVERALEFVQPDVVSFRAPPLPDPQSYHGPEGVLQMYADWTADFGEFEMTVVEIADAGERVVVEMVQQGTGRASGAAVAGRFWFVYTLAGGRIARQDVYNDKRQAWDAAGPSG